MDSLDPPAARGRNPRWHMCVRVCVGHPGLDPGVGENAAGVILLSDAGRRLCSKHACSGVARSAQRFACRARGHCCECAREHENTHLHDVAAPEYKVSLSMFVGRDSCLVPA